MVLVLPGCAGLDGFLSNTFSFETNPHRPMGDSLNMRRVQGLVATAEPVSPEDGNVWPRGVEKMPTLQDVEGETGQPARPGRAAAGNRRLSLAQPPASAEPAPAPAPIAVVPATGAITATGPAIPVTGTERYQTVSTPTGTAVLVPNGNGTATLMRSDGSMETVPVPR